MAYAFETVCESGVEALFAAMEKPDPGFTDENWTEDEIMVKVANALESGLAILLNLDDPLSRAQQAASIAAALMYRVYKRLDAMHRGEFAPTLPLPPPAGI